MVVVTSQVPGGGEHHVQHASTVGDGPDSELEFVEVIDADEGGGPKSHG